MARFPRSQGRNIHGIFLLNKSLCITSNAALQQIKRLFSARKAGHSGSLDPLATGMLPICFGEATKFAQFILDADKEYSVVAQLGVKTTTGDVEGEVVEQRPVGDISSSKLEQVLAEFRGPIEQIPSMFSALKHQGQPLYKLARQGIEVPRAARTVQIYELTLVAHDKDTLTLKVHCSKGTYIRTLIEDIGEKLGCGAHVIQLHRNTVGAFREEQMQTFEASETLKQSGGFPVLDGQLLSIDSLLSAWPEVHLAQASAYYLRAGQAVMVPNAPTQGWVRLYMNQGHFLGVGEVLDDGRIAPRRLVKTASGCGANARLD
jgi:tRNA pseudouridine55 synthase